ncbi:MAG: response regulator [Deltaproteobacteria bacterium]|nr:response regulator [Candidatus Zymogenaceae bacterium]
MIPDNRLVMKGMLTVLSLPGLIQTIDTSKNIQILLKPESRKIGRLYFSKGKIIHSSVGDNVSGRKAFFRMMGWRDIPFEMFEMKYDAEELDQNISMDTTTLILEGMRQVDEIQRLEEVLPLYYKIKPNDEVKGELDPHEEEILSLISPGDFVKNILDKSPDYDLDIYKTMKRLMEKKAITFLRIKMLVIDDNRFFADLIQDVIEKIFSNLFTTLILDGGEKGINVILSQQKPDLVISDLLMDGKDGFDVIDAANQNNIPVIIMTSERRNKDMIIEMGAKYMHKSVLGSDDFTEVFRKTVLDTLTADH